MYILMMALFHYHVMKLDACVASLVDTDYYAACSAEDCQGGVGGACDGAVVTDYQLSVAVAASVASGEYADPCPRLQLDVQMVL